MEKEQQEVEAGRRVGSGGLKEQLSFMLRGGILFTFSKSGTIIFVEITSCLFFCSFLFLLFFSYYAKKLIFSKILSTCWQIYHFPVDFLMCSSLWAVTGWSSSLCFPLTHDHHSGYRESTNGTTKQPGGVPLGWTTVTLVFYEMQTKPGIVYCLLLVSVVLNSELQR